MQFTLNFFSSRKKALDIFRVRSISKALLFIVFTRFFFRLNSVFSFGNLLLFHKVGDDVDVVQQGVYLGFAPDGDVGQADAWHDTALEGVEHGRCDAFGNLGGHGSSFRTGRAGRVIQGRNLR